MPSQMAALCSTIQATSVRAKMDGRMEQWSTLEVCAVIRSLRFTATYWKFMKTVPGFGSMWLSDMSKRGSDDQ